MASNLFKPLKIAAGELKHRVVMAPLTRFRGDENGVLLPIAIEYYTQRSCVPGTLILSEATPVSERFGGVPHAPGIWTDAQIQRWKEVTDAVHANGCFMFCQLWAPGRAADPATLAKQGFPLVSSSAEPMADGAPVPKEMTEEEIQICISDFVKAAKNAIAAGFDGVEIHGANGYLVDQFTQDNCNKRSDRWGGSVENRARFAIETAKAVAEAVGAERLGMRLSPWSVFQGMKMKDPLPQFSYLIKELKKLKLGHLHVVESRVTNSEDIEKVEGIEFALDIWDNQSPVFVAGGFKPDSAKKAVDEEYKDKNIAVVFGRYFISTPDLVFRIQNGISPNQYDRSTFYLPMAEQGYLDYPFSEEFKSQKSA
ncbi:uncharacterized protein K452DRAFT_352149 [Aplosporella prunicola CBS 121167]|uniref:NADH:flavin oxidoreductase/NADH oxidase N-terminal domain-containing protein n=1 Tax=Aplosporella prunicola CBS 121167 TaxID=1176127 RepID=A0A6A6B6Z9_9PEZI|nr:uncharacterized protein K452DRAFT_352149 [Aplosporella prunicola CBS 121167]KAF2139790.1 hypothetical protein K452DRAFT_352149 [Aplosporella prunicola CBS 121167]